jgi:hypothetical protein
LAFLVDAGVLVGVVDVTQLVVHRDGLDPLTAVYNVPGIDRPMQFSGPTLGFRRRALTRSSAPSSALGW